MRGASGVRITATSCGATFRPESLAVAERHEPRLRSARVVPRRPGESADLPRQQRRESDRRPVLEVGADRLQPDRQAFARTADGKGSGRLARHRGNRGVREAVEIRHRVAIDGRRRLGTDVKVRQLLRAHPLRAQRGQEISSRCQRITSAITVPPVSALRRSVLSCHSKRPCGHGSPTSLILDTKRSAPGADPG
jgi:hypothetical protein